MLLAVPSVLVRAAATLLTSEKGRKGVGFLLVAIFAPVILVAAILCSNTAGGADHNNSAVEASFYGVTYSEGVPDEFRTHIADMQTAFSFLDSAVAEANATMTDGNRLDPIQVKAIFYVLCFGEAAPSQRAADRFVDCFFITEQRTRTVTVELEDGSVIEQEEPYTATVPLSLAAVYENLAVKLGKTITDEDKENAAHIYTMIAGNANGSDGTGASGGTIQINYGYGSGGTELDTSQFTNPAGKNADDLVQYALHAYQEHWGYVWGTFGHVLTESLFEAKLAQYPDALAGNADFIRQTWVGGRTTDCVGLIKGYGWLDAETEEKAEELMSRTQSVEYEPVYNLGETMMESFARLSRIEALCKQLPGLDCGACGAPSCKALAEDISKGEAKEEDCVYIMKEQLRKLMEQEKGGER